MSKKENRETYYLNITLNYQKITKITITDHYKEKHPDITDKLILEILKNKPDDEKIGYYEWVFGQKKRNVFPWNTKYLGKKYFLVFWFKDNTNNHLWIRNCYRKD